MGHLIDLTPESVMHAQAGGPYNVYSIRNPETGFVEVFHCFSNGGSNPNQKIYFSRRGLNRWLYIMSLDSNNKFHTREEYSLMFKTGRFRITTQKGRRKDL